MRVKTNFWYFNSAGHTDPGDGTAPDPLNRLQSVSYDTTADPNHSLQPGDANYYLRVLDAATVSYQYRQKTAGQPNELRDVTQVEKVTTSGVSTESYLFDAYDRVTTRTVKLDSRLSYPMITDYVYDSIGRVTDIYYPGKDVYNNTGRKRLQPSYDIASRLTSLTVDGQSHASNITYNAASQTTSLNVGVSGANQITENYSFEAQTGLLSSQTVVRGGSALLDLTYSYTNASGKRTGQLTKILNNANHNKDRGYVYDALGRLITAQGGPAGSPWTQNYSYDRYGNRLSVSGSGSSARNQGGSPTEKQVSFQAVSTGTPSTQVVQPTEKLAAKTDIELPDRTEASGSTLKSHHASGSASTSPPPPIPVDGHASLSYDSTTNRITTSGFSYDAAGNQVRALLPGGPSSQRFQYDAANRLANVRTDTSVIIASYTYGDSNERLMADDNGLRTYYASEGGTAIAEYTESGGSTTPTWSKSYIYLGARLLSTLTPNGSGGEFTQYHHPDRLGTRLVTNAQDTTYFEQQTLPFGTALNETPPAGAVSDSTNRRFTSYDRSSTTSLDYAINRHYDPQQGRFTQVDPIGMDSVSLTSPQTLNLYAYCINDPINHIDPSGLGFLKRLLNRIVNAIIHAVITAVFVFLQTLITSGGNFGAAVIAGAVAGGADLLKQLGWPSKGFGINPGGTPQWNPNAAAILSGGPSALSRYIIVNFRAQDPVTDVITTWIWESGSSRIAALLRRIKGALCRRVPTGRVSGVSGTVGFSGGLTGGVELIQNYRSGQISGFAFGGAQVGRNGIATGTLSTGFVWGLDDSNSNYSGGFSGVNGGAMIGGSLQSSSGGLTGSARDLIPDPRQVTSATLTLSRSVYPGVTYGATVTNYSQPLQMGRWWAQASNPNWIDTPLIGANQACR
jgi:RHS repeat-associated protein